MCERAGLIAQSVQAVATRAVVLALDGRGQEAREAATEAEELAEAPQLPDRPGREPGGARRGRRGSGEGARLLAEAQALWTELDRPLEAARCGLLAGVRLRDHDPGEAQRLLDAAAAECERLGVAHLAERARAAVGA